MKLLKYCLIVIPLFFGQIALTQGEEIDDLLAKMTENAEEFKQQINEIVLPDLEKAIDAEETAKQLFEAMQQGIRSYLTSLDNESAFKQLLSKYIQRLGEAKARNLEKYHRTNDPDYKENVDDYEKLELEAREISSRILEERKQAIFLLDKVKSQQDKVIEKIILSKFKKANVSLRKTLGNLQSMRENLDTLYTDTRSIGKRGGISN